MTEEVNAAAKWWADQLRHQLKHGPGVPDTGDSTNDLFLGLLQRMAEPFTPEQVDVFEQALARGLTAEYSKRPDSWQPDNPMWGSGLRCIGVDYQPCMILAEACKEAGIDEAKLPIKTSLWCNPGYVSALGGWNGKRETVYGVNPNAEAEEPFEELGEPERPAAVRPLMAGFLGGRFPMPGDFPSRSVGEVLNEEVDRRQGEQAAELRQAVGEGVFGPDVRMAPKAVRLPLPGDDGEAGLSDPTDSWKLADALTEQIGMMRTLGARPEQSPPEKLVTTATGAVMPESQANEVQRRLDEARERRKGEAERDEADDLELAAIARLGGSEEPSEK